MRFLLVPCLCMEWLPYTELFITWELLVSRNRLTGGGCKPVYAACFGNRLVVNDTFKRQNQLSGVDTGDDRKGTIEEASKTH